MKAVSFITLTSVLALTGLASVFPASADEGEFPINPDVVTTFQQDLLAQPPHGFATPPRGSGQGPQGYALPMADEAGVEAACIAISLSRILVKSEQAVTLFPSIAGVKLANETLLDETGVGEELCMNPFYTPDGSNPVEPPEVPLKQHLKLFVAEGGNILVCPLCWNSRGYTDEDLITVDDMEECTDPPLGEECGAIAVGSSSTVAPTFINAGKSIDF